jgi:hypothetical protein
VRRALPLVLLLLALVLGGCRLDVTAGLTIARDGSATAELLLRLDPAALAELDRLGVDPTAELAAVAGQVRDWEVTRGTDDDGALTVRLRRPAADAETAVDALRELSAGLVEADPAVLVDLEVEVDEAGAVRIDGTAGLRPPATAGATVDGVPIGPDAAELERLMAEAVSARFAVTVPGDLEDHDADRVEERTAIWELVPGPPRTVRVVASAPGGLPSWALVAAVAGVAVLVVGALLWWWRRGSGRGAR